MLNHDYLNLNHFHRTKPATRKQTEEGLEDDLDVSKLLTLDEYLARLQIIPGAGMDGHFRGWVKQKVKEKYSIAGSVKEAWEAGGGGKFSRKLPPGPDASRSSFN